MPRTRRDAREALGVPAARPHGPRLRRRLGGRRPGAARSSWRSPTARPRWSASRAATRSPAAARSRFADNERVRVLGFTEQMSDWMAAADAMIHATAGLTVLEAHIRGCPVISYGFSAGHLRANNAAFERFGIAEVARSDHELETPCATSPVSAAHRTPRSPRCPRSPRGRSRCGRASARSRSGGCAPRAPSPSPAWRSSRCAGDLGGPPREPAEAAAPGHQPDPHRHGQRHADGDAGGQEPRPGRFFAHRRRRNRRSRIRSLSRSGGRRAGLRSRRLRRGAFARRSGAVAGLHAGPALAPIVPAVGAGCRWSCARRASRVSPSPSTTARTRRAPRRCWRSSARPIRRRPSSSPASRSSSGPRWRPRSSPPATGSSCTATATATSCG